MTPFIAIEPTDDLDTIAELHQAALGEVEYTYAARCRENGDITLVATDRDGAPVGYLIASRPAEGAVELWEHAVVPTARGYGIGKALLRELAQRTDPGSMIVVDPARQLDLEKVEDYYSQYGFVAGRGEPWATATMVREATG